MGGDQHGDEAFQRRMRLVDLLRRRGSIRSGSVEAAMRRVERHRFLPGASLDEAYADDVVVTKRGPDGELLSSVSQPAMVAEMLEQLDVRPGHRVLEIGAGSGYNAAILATLAGDDGAVTTVDLDDDIVDAARARLTENGFARVDAVTADGERGVPEHAPYDRVIATVGTWDLPPAWWDQLVPGGRLVAPLRVRTAEQSVGFRYDGRTMDADSVVACGFLPMRGIGARPDRTVRLSRDRPVDLVVEADAPGPDPVGLLDVPGPTVWSGVVVGAESDCRPLPLRLACVFPGYGRISAPPDEYGPLDCLLPWASPAVADGAALAYLVRRGVAGGIEIGVRGSGGADALVERVTAAIREWDRDGRGTPRLRAYRAGDAVEGPVLTVVAKRHTRLAVFSR